MKTAHCTASAPLRKRRPAKRANKRERVVDTAFRAFRGQFLFEYNASMTAEATKTEVGSYFISNYPPFSQWSADRLDEARRALGSPPADVPLGLYLHIPFCR